jgi:hypothetical protein
VLSQLLALRKLSLLFMFSEADANKGGEEQAKRYKKSDGIASWRVYKAVCTTYFAEKVCENTANPKS